MKSLKINRLSRNFFLIGMSFLAISIGLGIYVAIIVARISNYGDINNQLNELQITVSRSTLAVKEFLLNAYTDEGFVKTGSNTSSSTFDSALAKSITQLNGINKSWFVNSTVKKEKTMLITHSLENYRKHFNELSQLFIEKGFKDLGLEGEMRKAVHFIENYPKGTNKEMLLTLRRHEKDFLLRKDPKYIEKFDADFEKFKEWSVTNKNYSTLDLEAILPELTNYKILFHHIADIEKLIGFSPDDGLRQKIESEYSIFGKELAELSNEAKKEQSRLTSYAWFVNMALLILFGILVTATILAVIYFTREVVKPIEQLNAAADEIANGHLSVSLEQLKSQKLVSDIVSGFEMLIGKLRYTINQIEDISSRKITQTIALNSDKDEIGQSLNKIMDQITVYDEEERKRKWATEGYAKFSEIIRNSATVKELAGTITSELVKYLGANQAGFFLVQQKDKNIQLELTAAYAYDRTKHLNKAILPGEGLIGQCYLENESIFMTDIPQQYLQITSGLGYANPRSLAIIPFKVNDVPEAVFEIASFKVLLPYQIQFLEKTGDAVASSIAGLRLNEKTNMLLANSISQTENLHAQEEEMRQNMEELAATQEEFERNEKIYLGRIDTLQQQVTELVKENKTLSQKTSFEKRSNKEVLQEFNEMQDGNHKSNQHSIKSLIDN